RPVSTRAGGALLPNARLDRGRRGRGPGDAATRLAQARDLPWPGDGTGLALRHRDQCLPGRARPARTPITAACGGGTRESVGAAIAAGERNRLAGTLPRRIAELTYRRRADRGTGDDRAGVPGRDPAPATAATGRTDLAGRARLERPGGRRGRGDDGDRRQQCIATRPNHAPGALAGTPAGLAPHPNVR